MGPRIDRWGTPYYGGKRSNICQCRHKTSCWLDRKQTNQGLHPINELIFPVYLIESSGLLYQKQHLGPAEPGLKTLQLEAAGRPVCLFADSCPREMSPD